VSSYAVAKHIFDKAFPMNYGKAWKSFRNVCQLIKKEGFMFDFFDEFLDKFDG
jgi:hypothetical protein